MKKKLFKKPLIIKKVYERLFKKKTKSNRIGKDSLKKRFPMVYIS